MWIATQSRMRFLPLAHIMEIDYTQARGERNFLLELGRQLNLSDSISCFYESFYPPEAISSRCFLVITFMLSPLREVLRVEDVILWLR